MRSVIAALTLLSLHAFAQSTTVGVVASTNPETAKKQADALASFVGAALKETAQPRIFADQEALAVALAKGDVDVALMGPLAWLRVPSGKGKLVFRTVRNGKSTYRSVLFASAKSKLNSLDALKKSKSTLKVAWVETSSASGYIVPKAMLLLNGINPVQAFDTQDFLGSHDAVCTAVAQGTYHVGATFSDPGAGNKVTGCEKALGKDAAKLKVVALSEEVPNDVLAVSEKFSAGRAQALADAAKAASKETLSAAFLADGTADVKDDDFSPIRKALDAFVP
jgi:phosphate/phosphite/phosphonate ABC transporter binding protein